MREKKNPEKAYFLQELIFSFNIENIESPVTTRNGLRDHSRIPK